jgi:hypothetical protein
VIKPWTSPLPLAANPLKTCYEVQHVNQESAGAALSANSHTFDSIPAKTKKAFKEVNVGLIDNQSATVNCNVETAQRS